MVFSLRHQFLATHLTLVLLFLKAPTTIQAQQEDPVANLSDAEMQIVFEVEEELFQEFFGPGEGDSPIQGGGEPVHYNSSNAPKAPEDWTRMLPPGYKHIDHPGSGHHTRLRPGDSVHLNSRTGTGYTLYYRPDGPGNGGGGGSEEPRHNDAPGTDFHTSMYPPDYKHNDAPGTGYHTGMFPPHWKHNDAPGTGSHTSRSHPPTPAPAPTREPTG